MKNVKLKFNDTWVDVEDGWLCIGDSENQILLKPEFFNKLLAAINYTHSCTELKDKYGEDFAYFVEKKVNARKIEDVYYYDDKLFLCADDLFKEYQKLTKPLIVQNALYKASF